MELKEYYVFIFYYVALYPLYGQTDVARATNRQSVTQGECTIKAS